MLMAATDARQYATATQRNRQPILDVLRRVLPPSGNILEIASGTGEHAVFFAPHFAPRLWIPSDPEPFLRSSIEDWRRDCLSQNLQLPLDLNVIKPDWERLVVFTSITAIVNINMIHISPWLACEGLMAGVGNILPIGGILYLYGPFRRNDQHTSPSNEVFDASLRDRNPEWGVRDLEAVVEVAESQGLQLEEIVEMPANNLSVIWKRT